MERVKDISGLERIELQIDNGVRRFVEDLDLVRLMCGFDAVISLTPKVETTLRSGYKPLIPLRICCNLIDLQLSLYINFPTAYPFEPLQIAGLKPFQIDSWTQSVSTDDLELRLKDFCDEKYGQHVPYIGDIIPFLIKSINKGSLVNECNPDIIYDGSMMKHTIAQISSEIEVSSVVTSFAHISSFSDQLESSNEQDALSGMDNYQPDNHELLFYITCRQCREFLFSSSNIISSPHQCSASSNPCTSLFLEEPTDWLQSKVINLNGKICCPGCEAKVGFWDWAGTKCSCGEWVVPAFQFHISKLDKKIGTRS